MADQTGPVGTLTVSEKLRARQIAGVAAVSAGNKPAVLAEMVAHLIADLLLLLHGRDDAEQAALKIVDHVLARTVSFARENERIANAALRGNAAPPVQQQSKK